MKDFSTLDGKKEFSKIYQNGKKWYCEQFVVYFLEDNANKFGVVVSKKIGKAVFRNLAKRRIRACFSAIKGDLKTGIYVIVAKQSINSFKFADLLNNLKWSFKKMGLFKSENFS